MKTFTITLILMIASVVSVSAVSQTEVSDFLLNYTLLEKGDTMKVEADMIYETTDCELTKIEQIQVKRFIGKFKRDTKNMTDLQKIAHAVKTISSTAEYEKGKRKLIDVLKGKTNCQGYAMMLHELMETANIENELVITKDHIYNIIDGEKMDMTLLYSIYRR